MNSPVCFLQPSVLKLNSLSGGIFWLGNPINSLVMLKNYLKAGFQNLVRNKAFSLINIAGLALGMSVCLLIAAYVKDELNYDSNFADPELRWSAR